MQVDFGLLLPEFLLASLGVLLLVVDFSFPWRSRRAQNAWLAAIAAAGLAIVFAVAVVTQRDVWETLYEDLVLVDRYALLFKALFTAAGAATVLISADYVYRRMRHPGEFYALVVFAVLGADLMASAGELLTAYIAVELLTFCLYVLVALSRGDGRSAEAAAKYILLGAISSALMLFGIAVLYGTTGETAFEPLGRAIIGPFGPTIALGLGLFFAGLGFKLSMAPFHLWAPDVYEGAPTPVTAIVAVLSKAAAFALVLRFLAVAGEWTLDEWQLPLAALAALTMTVGTLTALAQENIKRLLAYSSIAQVGFVLVGVVSLNESGADAVLLHLVGYAFTNLAAFAVVIIVEAKTGKEGIADYAGLASRSPFLAMVMASALFSLAGLPIFAGFITKFLLFTAAVEAGLMWLMVVAVVNSLISLYYYIRIIREMYVGESPVEGRLPLSVAASIPVWLLFAGTVLVGVYPAPFMDAIDAATNVLPPFWGE